MYRSKNKKDIENKNQDKESEKSMQKSYELISYYEGRKKGSHFSIGTRGQ